MDVFRVREQLIDDYRAFTASFVDVRDRRLAAHVGERLASGAQWPDPWLSLNPSFATGGTVAELVRDGLLHPECERIFRAKEHAADPGTRPLNPAPPPAGRRRDRQTGRSVRAHDGHRVRQVPGVPHPDRRPRPP